MYRLADFITKGSQAHLALLYAFTAIICWALSAYFYCFFADVPIFQLIAVAQLTGAAFAIWMERNTFRWWHVAERIATAWPFVILFVINQFSYVYAFRWAPAADVDLINYTWPILLVMGEALKTGRSLNRLHVFGILTCFSGLLVLFLPELLGVEHVMGSVSGYIGAAVAATTWTVYCLFGSPSDAKKSNVSMAADLLLGGLIFAAANTAHGTWQLPDATQTFLIAFYGIFCYGVAYPLWRKSLQMGSAPLIAGLANLTPILSIACLVVGGIVASTVSLWIATVMVAFGCYVLSRARAKGLEQPKVEAARSAAT